MLRRYNRHKSLILKGLTEIGELPRSRALKVSEGSFLWTCLRPKSHFGSLKFELALVFCMKALACVIHNVDSGGMGMGPQQRGNSTVPFTPSNAVNLL
jgi:hypothetical protein